MDRRHPLRKAVTGITPFAAGSWCILLWFADLEFEGHLCVVSRENLPNQSYPAGGGLSLKGAVSRKAREVERRTRERRVWSTRDEEMRLEWWWWCRDRV